MKISARASHPTTRPATAPPRSLPFRLTAALLVLGMTLLGCPPIDEPFAPRAGDLDYQREARIPFSHGHVNAIGGNLHVRRVDLSIDTHLGTFDVGATYDSSNGEWRWSFAPRYGSVFFTDEHGAVHDTSGIADGAAIPGTTWVKLDDRRMKTKSGRVHTFDGMHRLRSIHWGQAELPRLEIVSGSVAGGWQPVAIRQCLSESTCTPVYAIHYDTAGNVSAIDDPAGRRAEFQWVDGRLIAARDGLDVEEGRLGWRYEYTGNRLRAITNGEGERTEIDYDDGRVSQIRRVGEGDPTERFHYTGAVDGLYATRHWDALGQEHVYHYDADGRLHERENRAVDERTRWTWQGRRPSSRTEPDGTMRLFGWLDDDLVSEIEPSGNVRLSSYQPLGVDRNDPPHRPIRRIEDDLGLLEENAYDADGRRVSHTNGAGETTTFEYDGHGHLTKLERPSGKTTQLGPFGDHGHSFSVQSPGSITLEQSRFFDGVGNRTQGTAIGLPGLGAVARRSYDADRNVRGVELADGSEIGIEVRSDGQATRITRPGGDDNEMIFDALGRLVARRERVDDTWQSTSFEYDALDRRTAVERPNGMRQEWSFDAAGRVTLARNLRDGIVEGWRSFVYSGGRLVSSHDSLRGGSEYLSFDPAGRVDSIQHVDGRSTVYGYDARSRRASETFVEPDLQLVRTIGYGYDGAGRKTEIRDGLVTVLAREYRDGRVAEVRTGNGLVRTFEYEDQDEALRRVETRDSTGALRETTTVTRTLDWPAVDLDVVTTTMGGVDATTRETYQLSPFAHDGFFTNRPRVTRWTGDVGQRALDYDGRSNLIGEGATTFSFNGEGNRLLQVDSGSGAGLSYSYDEAGFATSRGGESITWAANGRITSHSLDYFSWDVLGSPISSTVGGVTSQSIFGGAVIGDAQGLPIRIDLDEVSIDLTSGGHLYRHLDLRGNVKFTSDETGATRSHYAYSPYRLEQVHGDGGDSLRFVARAEVGELMLMGARVYDPAAARFLSPDPIFQVVNQYAYTLGNPVWFHDRDGTQTTQQLDGGPDMGAAAKGLQSLGNTILLLAATVAAAGHVRLAIFLALVGQILVTIAGIMQGFAWNEPPRRRRRPTRRRLSSHGAGSWGKTLLTAA